MITEDSKEVCCSGSLTTACPLCDSTALGSTISETPYATIWENLANEWGASFSEVVSSALTPSAIVRLQTCSECGVQYFSPACPGTDSFYAELTSSSPYYYNEAKWEFGFVRQFLAPEAKVLDVACGKGAFLRSICDTVHEAVGIDTNPDATVDDHESRFVIFTRPIDDYSRQYEEYFDFVSAFQVLEHLTKVLPFVRSAYRCVKRGGILALSVPNRERRKDSSFGSLDYPPHHLSRWTQEQLIFVARQLGGRVVVVAKEPLNRAQTIGALRTQELPQWIPVGFFGRERLFKIVSRLALTYPISLAWRGMRLNERLNMYGHSMLIIIKKPGTAECAA